MTTKFKPPVPRIAPMASTLVYTSTGGHTVYQGRKSGTFQSEFEVRRPDSTVIASMTFYQYAERLADQMDRITKVQAA
jgi:hypothetical protein